MSDLIDRQAAIRETWREPTYFDPLNVMTEMRDRLKALPSAEPEIVRCGDCKYYNPIGVCIEMSSAVCEDSFCCWAERKENG